jgi:hypothetical protein
MVEVGEDDFRIQPAAHQIPQRGQERFQPRLVLGRDTPWYQEAGLSRSTKPV